MRKTDFQVTLRKCRRLSGKQVAGVFGLILLMTLGAAASRGAEISGQEGVARMQAARNEVSNVRSNIVLTLLELYRIQADRDPAHPQFQVFTNQLASMQELVRTFAKRAEEMKAKGDAYFADWETKTAAINNPEQRTQAERRYTERQKSYRELTRYMQEARAPFLVFVDELQSIKALLEGEHTPEKIAQAKDAFSKANWRCVDVQRALMEVELRFDQLAASFAQERAPAPQR